MYDAFDRSGGSAVRRRFKAGSGGRFSPSFGVRKGLLADIERPLPPDIQNQRHSRRIPLSFDITFDGTRRRVAGNLSSGGAMFLAPVMVRGSHVEISVHLAGTGERRAIGEIIATHVQGTRIAYHVRFTDPKAMGEVLALVEKNPGLVARC